jgi:large subunit ribosomal protein L23
MKPSPHQILIRPILTEKTTHGIEAMNAYVFEVAPRANKLEVRQAVEDLFDVKVVKVNLLNRRGKRKRVGRSVGFGKDTRRAVVTLKSGDKIDVY